MSVSIDPSLLTSDTTLTYALARSLVKKTQEIALANHCSGVAAAYDREGRLLCLDTSGGNASNTVIVAAKAQTVRGSRRSSLRQRQRMDASGQRREDFAGVLGSLFGGGVALYLNDSWNDYLGAVVFSGASEVQDQQFGAEAANSFGLVTDVDQPPLAKP